MFAKPDLLIQSIVLVLLTAKHVASSLAKIPSPPEATKSAVEQACTESAAAAYTPSRVHDLCQSDRKSLVHSVQYFDDASSEHFSMHEADKELNTEYVHIEHPASIES
jgi:hypothetical protein